MVITVGHNNIICKTSESFESSINEQMKAMTSELWVSEHGGNDEYPCFGILIDEDKASLTFFDEDGSCFVSVGNGSSSETISFCNGQYEVTGSHIINKSKAMAILMDFFNNRCLSDSVKWEQLY